MHCINRTQHTNKIDTDGTKELDEDEIIAHELYLRHWGC